jgi:hypothetical protein
MGDDLNLVYSFSLAERAVSPRQSQFLLVGTACCGSGLLGAGADLLGVARPSDTGRRCCSCRSGAPLPDPCRSRYCSIKSCRLRSRSPTDCQTSSSTEIKPSGATRAWFSDREGKNG